MNRCRVAGGKPWNGKFYVEMAQALERACFDYIMFEDKLDDFGILRRHRRNLFEARIWDFPRSMTRFRSRQ